MWEPREWIRKCQGKDWKRLEEDQQDAEVEERLGGEDIGDMGNADCSFVL